VGGQLCHKKCAGCERNFFLISVIESLLVPKFRNHSIQFEEITATAATKSITGPAVACVGWIPFYFDVSELPECDLLHHKMAEPVLGFQSAASILLFSGNFCESGSGSDSPARFGGPAQFIDFLESKEFRGALALDDVELIVNKAGTPLRVSFKSLRRPGYTPMRVRVGRQVLTHHDGARGSHPGDVEDVKVEPESDGVTIRIGLRFKIGRVGELAGYFFTHRWAPSALITMEYRIDSSGQKTAKVWGSLIPSQSIYVGWAKRAQHNMVGNSSDEIDRFLDAGSCRDAPRRLFFDETIT
jgi:hypothetical protein